MRRVGRLLSVPSDRPFNKEIIPHAALRSVGSEDRRGPRRITPGGSLSDLISLPDQPVVPTPVCEYTTHKMHAQRTDDGGIA